MVVAVTVVHLWRARSDGLAPRNGDDDTDPDGEAMLLAQRTAPTGAFLRVLRRRRERATAVLSTRPEIRPECLMSISLAPRDLGALVAAAGCWGLGTAVSKRAVAEIPPITLLFVQLAVSVAFLSVASLVRGERMPTSGEGVRLSRLGLLNPGMAYALSLLGLAQISASLSVLLWALEPILILALAMLVLRERPGATLLILSATAVGGLFLVVYDPAASGAIIGIVLTVAGVGCCAVYTVATRRWLPSADETLPVLLGQQVHGFALALALLVGAAAARATILPASVSPAAVASAVLSGVLYYGLAYSFYLSALRRVSASLAAMSFYLIPVFGVAAASAFGDRLSPVQWVGAVVVAGSVASIGFRSMSATPAVAAPDGTIPRY
jgi:probable blue pigment (indigoidine) exporter